MYEAEPLKGAEVVSRVKDPACLRVNLRYCGGISRLFSRVIAPFTAKIPPNTVSLPSVNSDKLRE